MKRYALDLFCKAGGASMGLHRAGFEVVGVDIEPQPNYPFRFVHADALEYPLDGFDLIWASPPCQAFTAYKRRAGHVRPRANLIPAMRQRLLETAVPFVIENVPRAPLRDPVTLCGSMFGLDVRRHRLFECSFSIMQPACNHHGWTERRYPGATNRGPRFTCEVGVWRIPLEVQQRAMGIDWMTREELSQAIPPAYAQWLGERALEQLERAA